MMTHSLFRQKPEAIDFRVFIPVFFVMSGLQFDLPALFASPTTILRVPVFLAALLIVRGLSALPPARRHPLLNGCGTVAGDLAVLHRRSNPDGQRARFDHEGDGRSIHRRCLAVCPDLPASCANPLAPPRDGFPARPETE
jgi:hypothetical protein